MQEESLCGSQIVQIVESSYKELEIEMGILDFREICSANSNHDSVKGAEAGKSNLPDDFELFCQEFFTNVKRYKIFRSVSHGPDLGIDLGVEEMTPSGPRKWLVSCKHYAHSDKYVPEEKERGIVERVGSWGCEGFIPFYTKVPSTTLSQMIQGAETYIKVERYYKERIERELLSDSEGVSIAARYFPKSMINHYSNFIQPLNQFSYEDIVFKNDIASLNGWKARISDDPELTSRIIKQLIKDANIMAGFKLHEPYFKKALREAISRYSELFVLAPGGDIDEPRSYKPTWDVFKLKAIAKQDGLSKAFFVGAVWSFWDFRRANEVFADFMIVWSKDDFHGTADFDDYKRTEAYRKYHASVLERGLLTPGLLGLKLQDKERDIVARMFAYANVIK